MSENVSWKDFDKLHVVRRMRELVGKWWNIQINFTDAKGLLRGVPDGKFFNPLNPICQAIVSDEKGFQDRRNTARQTTVDTMSSKGARLSRCVTGVSTLTVPVKIDGKFMGCVYGDGFIVEENAAEQQALVKNYIERNLSTVPGPCK